MEKIVDIFKFFLEKRFIPTIISIALAITTYLVIPENCWIVSKLTKSLFLVLCFCIFFIAISFVCWLFHMAKAMWARKENKLYYQKKQIEDNKAVIEEINAFVDSLSPQDKALILEFIRNGNKPLLEVAHKGTCGTFLGNESLFNSTLFSGGIMQMDLDKHWITNEMYDALNKGFKPVGDLKLYRLKENIYHDFTLVYSTTGKLGNFD